MAGETKRIKAKVNEITGKARAKAKTGKLTGNKKPQAEGTIQQVNGKVEGAIYQLKTRR